MKVAIVGGGAIGLLFASYLHIARIESVVLTRRTEQANNLRKEQLSCVRNEKKYEMSVDARFIEDEQLSSYDFIIVAVKQYQLESVIPYLQKAKGASLLFLQNGMGHLKWLDTLIHKNVYVGVVEHGVIRESDCSILHTGIGQTRVSVYQGCVDPLDHFVEKVSQSNFCLVRMEQWYMMLARKLTANAVINPLTALYRVPNGELIHNEHFFKQVELVFSEVMSILRLSNPNIVWEEVLEICRKTAENRSSMLKDIEEARSTEVEAILGYLLSEAEKTKQSVPVISFLYKSIMGIESYHRGSIY